VATTTEHSRTIHLPASGPQAPASAVGARRKGLKLTDLAVGETVRILRVSIEDTGCRKRFAELGLAEGMKVTVTSTGDTLMLVIGGVNGTRMGLAARCAQEILVARLS
jgi:Fe2+ transport system protein FeoA